MSTASAVPAPAADEARRILENPPRAEDRPPSAASSRIRPKSRRSSPGKYIQKLIEERSSKATSRPATPHRTRSDQPLASNRFFHRPPEEPVGQAMPPGRLRLFLAGWMIRRAECISPSSGTPGEGWGGGSREWFPLDTTPSLTLPRSTGGGVEARRGNGCAVRLFQLR